MIRHGQIHTAETLVVFRLEMPDGKTRVAGKIVQLHGSKVFYRKFKGAKLHKWDALSFDARLPAKLEEWAVDFIDSVDEDGQLYRIPAHVFARYATKAQHNRLEGPQMYLDTKYWTVYPRCLYTTTHKLEEELIPWPKEPWAPVTPPGTQKEPQPQLSPQLGLFGDDVAPVTASRTKHRPGA